MKFIIATLLFLNCIAALVAADFDLEATISENDVPPFSDVTIDYTLTNNGPQRHIPIGLGEINRYLFVYVQYEDEDEVLWKNPDLPDASFPPSPREFFLPGQQLAASATISWHTDMPVFDRIGNNSVRLKWRGPNGDIWSEPVTLTVSQTEPSSAQALKILQDANAMEALLVSYWQRKETAFSTAEPSSPIDQAIAEVEENFSDSVYAKMISEARENAGVSQIKSKPVLKPEEAIR